MHIVIVGNGAAGMQAALEVRRREPAWPITIVSEESPHPIARTALMYVFAGQLRARDLEPYERDHCRQLRLDTVHDRVLGIDLQGKRLVLANDPRGLAYDRLLVATGSRFRPGAWPGSELLGVGGFVTLADLAWLSREVLGQDPTGDRNVSREGSGLLSPYAPRPSAAQRRGRLARKPVVIGGGLIGMEVCELLASEGLRPHFVMRSPHLWPTALDAREAAWVRSHLLEKGVGGIVETEVVSLEGDDAGCVQAVQTQGGRIEADLVVLATGVVPNTAWLAGQLELDPPSGAVRVDAGLRTSAPDVFAAGDCAAVPQPGGTVAPELLWYTARDQGRVAGAQLSGDAQARYVRGPVYNSAKLFDLEFTTVGELGAALPQRTMRFFHEQGRIRSTSRLVASEGALVGANFIGRRWDHSVLLEWIAARKPLDWVIEHLAEASFDTEFVPKLDAPRARWEH